MKKSESLKNEVNQTVSEEKNTDIRLDPTKEYVYFTNLNVIESELDIEYKDIVINFEDKENIQNIINDENKEYFESVKYDENNEEAIYNHLVSAKFNKFDVVYFNSYISIIKNTYNFDYKKLVTFTQSKAYVFDKKTGKLYNNDELLSIFNINKDNIKNEISTYLNDQNLITDNPINVEDTINNISSYELYVDNLGRLVVTILVKCEQSDYNEVIVLS
ncbi:MAG: hypothetical protein ACI4XR_00430 [Bacilli bacterium]